MRREVVVLFTLVLQLVLVKNYSNDTVGATAFGALLRQTYGSMLRCMDSDRVKGDVPIPLLECSVYVGARYQSRL